MCTVSRARKVVLGLSIFACIGYSFHAWTLEVTDKNGFSRCVTSPKYAHFVAVMGNIDTVITLIVPSAAIFAMNLRITYKIIYVFKHHNLLTTSSSTEFTTDSRVHNRYGQDNKTLYTLDEATNRNKNNSAEVSTITKPLTEVSRLDSENCSKRYNIVRNTAQIKITKMLLVVSTIFLILNLPSHSVRVYAFLVNFVSSPYRPPLIMVLLQQAFNMTYNLNFAINIFLYSFCGKNFRAALWRLSRKTCQRFIQMFCRKWSPRYHRNNRHNRNRRSYSRGQTTSIRMSRC